MKYIFTLLTIVLTCITVSAHDVEVDGIYYNLVSKTKEAVVTFKGSSYSEYSNEYSGAVTIPETIVSDGVTYSVTSIGSYAFCYCSGLTSVAIPNSVKSIGDSAFEGCSGLTSVTIPNSVTSIGDTAFSVCSGLTSVTIPNSVTSIGCAAFGICRRLTSVSVDANNKYYYSEENVIYTKDKSTLVYCMSSIKGAFNIPNSVTSIGNNAFWCCEDLTSVTIPNSVTSIGDVAFEGCSGLTSVTIPNSVTSIGDFAFDNCKRLISLTIPNSVMSIGRSTFSGCSGLTSVTIPNSVTRIRSGAFMHCSGLTSVTIGSSVTSIGGGAFYGCGNLKTVTCAATSVPSIEANAFTGVNVNNATLIVPEEAIQAYRTTAPWSEFGTIVSIEADAAATAEANKFKTDNADILGKTTETVTSSDLETINKALEDYSKLSEAAKDKLTNSEKALLDSLKKKAEELKNGIIASGTCGADGDNITWVLDDKGTLTLSGSGKMKNYQLRATSIIPWYTYRSQIIKVLISNGVNSIGNSAFYNCKYLKTVSIGNTVTTIGEFAFRQCDELQYIIIPNSITSIEKYAFYKCSSLGSVTIGKSTMSIGEQTFAYCSGLTSISFGNSVVGIGDWAFLGCDKLISVNINSLESWCNSHFEYAVSNPLVYAHHLLLNGKEIVDLEIPNTVTSIGDYAFEYCSSFNSITIPSTVSSIGKGAFMRCNNNTSLVVDENNSNYCSIDNVLYTKDKTGLLYAGNRNGSYVIPNTVECVGFGAFAGCTQLTSVTIPNSVRTIEGRAFQSCSGLTSVTIPNSVTSIGEYAFVACSGLASVTIGNSVTSIDDYAIYNCEALNEILCRATTPPTVKSDALFGINKNTCKLYVPETSLETYKSAEQWSKFVTILSLEEFEANKFKTDNAVILGKTTETVTSSDLDAINKALDDYSILSEAAKNKLTNGEKALLDSLKTKAEELKAAEEADAAATAEANTFKTNNATILGKTVSTVKSSDLTAINKALDDYNKLSEAAKNKLTTGEKALLNSLKTKAEELKAAEEADAAATTEANKFKTDNADILAKTTSTVASSDLTAITSALSAYDKLSSAAKSKLTTEKQLLDSLKTKAEELKAAEEADAAATTEANKFKTDNADILAKTTSTVASSDLTAITSALSAYDKLSSAAKSKLTTEKQLLDSLKTKAEELKAAEEADAAATAEANAFKTNNANILGKTTSTVKSSDLTAITSALSAYDKLSSAAKSKLTTEKQLLDFLKTKAEDLKAAEDADAATKAEANKFKTDNADILAKTTSTVTSSDIASITNALTAYNNLSDAAKAILTTEKQLLDLLKTKAEELKAAEAADAAATSEANKFKTDNADILSKTASTVASSDLAAIQSALDAYDELSDAAQEKLATEKQFLDSLKDKAEKLKAAEEADAVATAEANKFKDDNADILGKNADEITADDVDAINKAQEDYNNLSDAAKDKLKDEKVNIDNKKEKVDAIMTSISSTNASKSNDKYYSLSGQRISSSAKGIVIKNGKKIYVNPSMRLNRN